MDDEMQHERVGTNSDKILREFEKEPHLSNNLQTHGYQTLSVLCIIVKVQFL